MTEGVHYQVTYADNIRCGLARAEITGIGRCAERGDTRPHIEYFAIVPASPDVVSLETQKGEIRLSVTDLSDTGADGYEAQYRMKGSKEWVTAAFEAGRTDLVISDLKAGEYEIQVRAFVDNTADSVPEEHRKIAYGPYGDIRTVTVP